MRTLFLGFRDDSVHLNLHSAGIRISYLLSKELILTGDLHYLLDIRTSLANLDMEGKINFINEHDEEFFSDDKAVIPAMIKAYKQMKNLKIRSKEEIVKIKKTEASIDTFFKIILDEYAESFNPTGFPQLKDITGKPGVGFCHVNYPESEWKDHETNSLSELLTDRLTGEGPGIPEAHFLNYGFFNSEFHTQQKVMLPYENKFHGNGFFISLFKCNNLNKFGVSDLDVIRNETITELERLQQALDAFINLKSKPEEAFRYLKREVADAAAKFQTRFDNTDLVKTYKHHDYYTKVNLEVCTGLIPWETIYKYYRFNKIVQGKSAEVIDQAQTPAGMMPVIILTFDNKPVKTWTSLFRRKKKAPETQTISKKKSLEL